MKAKIIKVVEDFPLITVYYESGVSRTYETIWLVPETTWHFMNDAKVYRDNNGRKIFTMQKEN